MFFVNKGYYNSHSCNGHVLSNSSVINQALFFIPCPFITSLHFGKLISNVVLIILCRPKMSIRGYSKVLISVGFQSN